MARKKQQKPWQYRVSFGLVFVLLLLVFGYFWQSFTVIREMQPIRIAVEKLRDRPAALETGGKTNSEDQQTPVGNDKQ